jgi:hypothetical protein
MRLTQIAAVLFVGLVTAHMQCPCSAVPLTIANPGFETPAFSDGGYDFLVEPSQQGAWGWQIGDGAFIYNPLASDYTGAAGNGTPSGGAGAQIAGIYQFGDYAIAQQLVGSDMIPSNDDDPLVQEGTIYALTLAIGQRALGNPNSSWGGYIIQLRAGGASGPLLGEETNVITPPPGTFVTRTLAINCPTFTNPELYGQPIFIVLHKATESLTATVDYDNVQLDATKISPIFSANFNETGLVDAVDLAAWKTNFGANCLDATHSHGNADGDDFVNGHDFLLWQQQHGATGAAATIPEPAGWLLLGLATMCMRTPVRPSKA